MANNYVVDQEGATFIAATQRPDGTWRKPRKVKEGYVPQDEVPLYESKGKIFEKNQPIYPVGLSEEYIREAQQRRQAAENKQKLIPGLPSAASSKKKKKKPSSEIAAVQPAEDLLTTYSSYNNEPARSRDDEWTRVGGKGSKNTVTPASVPVKKEKEPRKVPVMNEKAKEPEPKPAEACDPAKRVKNLRKRLKEMESIEQKKASGEKLEKEQVDKLSRKRDVEKEIAQLVRKFHLS